MSSRRVKVYSKKNKKIILHSRKKYKKKRSRKKYKKKIKKYTKEVQVKRANVATPQRGKNRIACLKVY